MILSLILFGSLYLIYQPVVQAAPFIGPIGGMVASAGVSAGMMGGFSLYSADKAAQQQRKIDMYVTKQGLNDAKSQYIDKKDQAEAMKHMAQKSTKSPLLAYQSQMLQAQQENPESPSALTTQEPSQSATTPVSPSSESTITFFFGNSCASGPSVTAYLSDFSDTLTDELRNKVTSILITNVKAGTQVELYAGMEPTTAKAYSKFISKTNLPNLRMCNLETSSESANHLYVVKPGISKGDLIGKINYLFVKT